MSKTRIATIPLKDESNLPSLKISFDYIDVPKPHYFPTFPHYFNQFIMSYLSGSDLNKVLTVNKNFYLSYANSSSLRLIHLQWQFDHGIRDYIDKKVDDLENEINTRRKNGRSSLDGETEVPGIPRPLDKITTTSLWCCVPGSSVCFMTCCFQCPATDCIGTSPACVTVAPMSACAINWGHNCFPLAIPCVVGYGLMGCGLLTYVSLKAYRKIRSFYYKDSTSDLSVYRDGQLQLINNECKNIASTLLMKLSFLKVQEKEKIPETDAARLVNTLT